MTNYQELMRQKAALDLQIKEARKRERSDAAARVRAMVAEYELTQRDVFPSGRRASAGSGSKISPKYRDPATGATWTGRGKAPRWIAGHERSRFLIAR
ncbi:MAG: H-NS histone family protein [Burkholderiaceae bacterium]|jgi:DNA-binding protein H-NS|nr:H-NS histone family protein [Burkholderiaceae bacterium]